MSVPLKVKLTIEKARGAFSYVGANMATGHGDGYQDSHGELAATHYKLVHSIFSPNATRETKEHFARKLHEFIGRGIPMYSGDEEVDLTKPALRSMCSQDWPDDAADLIERLFKAYVAAGQIEVQDCGFPLTYSLPDDRPKDGSLLELAVNRGSHHAVRALLDLGADISCVPFKRSVIVPNSTTNPSKRVEVERGDILGYAMAMGRYSNPLFKHLTEAVMRKTLEAPSPSSSTEDADQPPQSADAPLPGARPRRAAL
ncbi:hypothetical protein [Hydrogenophaga sp. 2FB]|uniref:hypothetical protein n=1 Tax=Hydrogenophaga sp. 2FB TaxID=2502187 RepID=UPI0010F9901B|nr:hypothetical protein [Hydrogenophaga sp. 2FB]